MESPVDDSLPMLPPRQIEEPVYYPVYYENQRQHQKKPDIFYDLDKTTIIMLVAVFVIGFFMGKSMTPVILKTV